MGAGSDRKTRPRARAQKACRPGPTGLAVPRDVALAAFIEVAPVAVAMTDRDLKFRMASSRWLADFGATLESIVGKSSYDLAPETRKYAHLHEQVLAGGQVFGDAEDVVLPNGEHRWLAWEASPWRGDDGEIGGMLIISRDLTAQKQAERELREARAYAATILENVPTPLVVKDVATGRIMTMNHAMEELYGINREEHVGKTLAEIISPEFADQVAVEDQQAIESGKPLVIEDVEMQTARGDLRHVRKTKVAIDGGGGRTYLLSISEDITERLKAQQDLEGTRAFLSTVLDNIPAPLVVKDGETGRFLILNDAAEDLMGTSREKHLGKTAYEIFPKEVADKFAEQDRQVMESGELMILEDESVSSLTKGTRRLRTKKLAAAGADGRPLLLAISEDITERKEAQAELERTRKFLADVLDSAPMPMLVKDARDGRIIMMNRASEELMGQSREKLIGKTAQDMFPPDQAKLFVEQDRAALESGQVQVIDDTEIKTKLRGMRTMRMLKVGLHDPDGDPCVLTISEDVTERKLAQDALIEALARAEAASVAKSEFLANMSHEIRTPLNGVLGLADALSHMDLPPRQQEIVKMILSSGQALTMLLGDVLDLAKAEAGALALNPEGFSVRETVGQAAFLFERVARDKGLDFKVSFDPDGPDWLVGDPLRIKQVVSNLISNAVKFTTEGEVAIEVETAPRARGKAVLRVTVRDTGPGFTEETRAKLFGRFEQGDGTITRRYGGTGLGLSIANTLAHMMGGDITCSATPGEGAAFEFSARLKVDRQAPVEAPAAPVRELGSDRRPRVLLAEDHFVNQQVIQLMLGEMAELIITADGQAALDAFLEGPPFDVVLMDTQMPVMDGLTATRRIREAEARGGLARTPIISLTANAMGHQVEACLKAGADLHLAKPVTSAGLFSAINAVLAGGGAEAPRKSA